jgi:hypothetical protein
MRPTPSARSGVRGWTAQATRAQDAYAGNPLIGGLIAATVGAIVGTSVPLTQTENEQLGDLGDAARDKLGEQKDRLVSAAREKKDELVDQVQQSTQSAGSDTMRSEDRQATAPAQT